MNVSLTPELEHFVNQKVESGRYQTASEVIRDGLRLLVQQDELHLKKLENLRREIAMGIRQAEDGKLSPLNARETLSKVRRKTLRKDT